LHYHSIRQETVSSLDQGIETLRIPIQDPHDMSRLQLESQRGTYAVVEWLLSELGRSAEIERVCGLTGQTTQGKVIIILEMRQPGKQFEAELERWGYGAIPILCDRAKSKEKFSDTHKPWWLTTGETNLVRTLQEGDTTTP
jgi:hypothetical protein